LLDAMRVGGQEGMQTFDGDIERLIRNGTLDRETGLAYATNPGNLELDMSDLKMEAEADPLLETSGK
jgi:twitching motility protein PilT